MHDAHDNIKSQSRKCYFNVHREAFTYPQKGTKISSYIMHHEKCNVPLDSLNYDFIVNSTLL